MQVKERTKRKSLKAVSDEQIKAEYAEFILENISQRMAGQIREEADEQGPIKAKIAEEAIRDLSSAVRALADDGTIP